MLIISSLIKETTMYQLIVIFICIAISLLATACNTMEGLGKDVQKGGKKLERSADKNK